jgi:putative ABC transport system substrate-binding protein
MRRRPFLALFSAALVWSARGSAQQGNRVYRVGILAPVPADHDRASLDAFRNKLRDLGYAEGKNLVLVYRSADGDPDRFGQLASELAHAGVDLIVTRGTPAARAAKDASGSRPVLMVTMGDPKNFAATYSKPGGNITGVVTFSTELTGKCVELLMSLVPNARRIGLLHNMANPAVPPEWEETKAAANALGVDAELLDVRNEADIRTAMDRAAHQRLDALLVGADGITKLHGNLIIAEAARLRLPAMYPGRDFVEAGGLISYAVSFPELYVRLADLAAKILQGAKPGDLPVEQPTKFELSVNLKTAKALDLTIPSTLLARSDEVIE